MILLDKKDYVKDNEFLKNVSVSISFMRYRNYCTDYVQSYTTGHLQTYDGCGSPEDRRDPEDFRQETVTRKCVRD